MTYKNILIALAIVLLIFNGSVYANKTNKNEAVNNLMSRYEDLTDYLLNHGITEGLMVIEKINKEISQVDKFITAKNKELLTINQNKINDFVKVKDYSSITLVAVDSYQILASELDYSKMKIPKEIVQFDYIGFKIKSLLIQKEIDWHLLNDSADKEVIMWEKIKDRIKSNGLKDLMNDIVYEIKKSAKLKNADMLNFSAQMNLDAVDLLEVYFENK